MITLSPCFKLFREITLLRVQPSKHWNIFSQRHEEKMMERLQKSYSTFLSICVSNSRCTAGFGCKTVLVMVWDPESGRQLCKGDFEK